MNLKAYMDAGYVPVAGVREDKLSNFIGLDVVEVNDGRVVVDIGEGLCVVSKKWAYEGGILFAIE